jgi:hypothetical protein
MGETRMAQAADMTSRPAARPPIRAPRRFKRKKRKPDRSINRYSPEAVHGPPSQEILCGLARSFGAQGAQLKT